MGFDQYGHFLHIYSSGPEYYPSASEATMKDMDKLIICIKTIYYRNKTNKITTKVVQVHSLIKAEWRIYVSKLNSLVQIIACHLYGTKPSLEPIREYC